MKCWCAVCSAAKGYWTHNNEAIQRGSQVESLLSFSGQDGAQVGRQPLSNSPAVYYFQNIQIFDNNRKLLLVGWQTRR